VTPEAAEYLGKARELLDEATTALGVNLNNAAGRAAYLAGFHAAQAFLSTQSERVPKTHSGLRSEFARRVKDEPRITELQRAFLGRAYSFKAIADYETGPASHVSHEQAAKAIEEARGFVAAVAALIPEGTAP
jgi:uncharacterized protein (UPF0332 family)